MAETPMTKKLHWKREPDAHDYPAARQYLSLLVTPMLAKAVVVTLRKAVIVSYKAKDLLRASDLRLLPPDNFHVAKDLAKIAKGVKLSPVLVVRGDLTRGRALTIADGYHRICASFHVREDADIPCRIADLPAS